MGDDGRLYVAEDLVPAYRDQIISLASVLTPNQFEAELLTGITIDSKSSALQACQSLHKRGIATTVSLPFCNFSAAATVRSALTHDVRLMMF